MAIFFFTQDEQKQHLKPVYDFQLYMKGEWHSVSAQNIVDVLRGGAGHTGIILSLSSTLWGKIARFLTMFQFLEEKFVRLSIIFWRTEGE